MTFFVRGFWSPLFVFCIFRASESLFGEIYLLEVVRFFYKDHFLLYDFFGRGFRGPFLHFSCLRGPLRQNLYSRGGNNFRQGSFFLLRPFLFFTFFVLWYPFWKNLFTRGGNKLQRGSFFILWLFSSEASEALFCFLRFLHSSCLRGLLRKNLFTWGGNNFQQGSFFILWIFSSGALFCFLRFSGLRGHLWQNLFTWGGNDFRQGSYFILWLFSSKALFHFLRFLGLRSPFLKKFIYSRW